MNVLGWQYLGLVYRKLFNYIYIYIYIYTHIYIYIYCFILDILFISTRKGLCI